MKDENWDFINMLMTLENINTAIKKHRGIADESVWVCRWSCRWGKSQFIRAQQWKALDNLIFFSSEFEKYFELVCPCIEKLFTSKSVRNLGSSIDKDLTMSTQIQRNTDLFHLLHQKSIKGYLTMDSLKTIASTWVLSRID